MAASTVVKETSPFNLTYNVAPMDIGSGYAKGIGQAGASIADALGKVTDIMSQSQAANDQIDALSKMKDSQGNSLISSEDRDTWLSKGLGARQAMVGEVMGRLHTSYKSYLDQQNALAVEGARAQSGLAQQGAVTSGSISLAQEKSRLDAEAEARKNIQFTDSEEIKQAEAERQRRLIEKNQSEALKSPFGGGALH